MQWYRINLIFAFACSLWAPASEATSGRMVGRFEDRQEVILPLKMTDVSLDITANLVHATVRQVFYNDQDQNLEAIYTFPLPANAVVTSMTLVTGDRRIRSTVMEKEAAVETYTTARAEGKKAALLEQTQANLFTTSVANFAPGEEIEVELAYLEQLPFTGSLYEVSVPTTFGPRYLPRILPAAAPTEPDGEAAARVLPEAPDLVAPQAVVADRFSDHLFNLTAKVQGLPVRDIYSNTHLIDVTETGVDSFQVELAGGGDLPNRDFVLKLELWEDETPQIEFVQSQGREGTHGLLTVFPPLTENPNLRPAPREVTFLVDTSGSMAGVSIEQAREGLRRCLDLLNPGDRFNIVRFSDDVTAFSPKALDFDEGTHAEALDYIDKLQANGGTEMLQALDRVLGLSGDPGYLRMLIFLTDGDVGNHQELMNLVRQKLGRTRIFSFGVGTAPNEFLLKRLSETGFGVSNFIRNQDDIGQVIGDFFATINAPVLTDVQVTWRTRAGHVFDDALAFPAVVPDVFLGRPIQLCYRYDEFFDGSIEVSGLLGDKPVTYAFQTQTAEKRQHPGIESLFGKALLDDLMVEWTNAKGAQQETIRTDVVQVALAYQLMSRFTSRVAVEERVTTAGDPQSVAVPVLAKQGSAPAFAATATDDYRYLILGLILLLCACLLHVLRRLATFTPSASAGGRSHPPRV